MMQQIDNIHILKSDKSYFCLLCKETITTYKHGEEGLFIDHHLQGSEHLERKKNLFKSCIPDPLCNSHESKYLDIIFNSVFDVSWEIGNESSYICDRNGSTFCLICTKQISEAFKLNYNFQAELIFHLESKTHIENVKDSVCWLYYFNNDTNYVLFHKFELYCSFCKQFLPCDKNMLLETASKHIKVDRLKIKKEESDCQNEDYFICPECDETIKMSNKNDLVYSLQAHLQNHEHVGNVSTENLATQILSTVISSMTDIEVELNKQFLDIWIRNFYCKLCQEQIEYSFRGYYVRSHFTSAKHNIKLNKTAVDYILSIDYDSCIVNEDREDFSHVLKSLSEQYPFNKMASHMTYLTIGSDVFKCLLCEKSIQFSNDGITILEHLKTKEHKKRTYRLNKEKYLLNKSGTITKSEKINVVKSSLSENSTLKSGKKDIIVLLNEKYVQMINGTGFCQLCQELISDSFDSGLKSHFLSAEHNNKLSEHTYNYVSNLPANSTVVLNSNRVKFKNVMTKLSSQSPFNEIPSLLNYISFTRRNFWCFLCNTSFPFSKKGCTVLPHFLSKCHKKAYASSGEHVTFEGKNENLKNARIPTSFISTGTRHSAVLSSMENLLLPGEPILMNRNEDNHLITVKQNSNKLSDSALNKKEILCERDLQRILRKTLVLSLNKPYFSVVDNEIVCLICQETIQCTDNCSLLKKHVFSRTHNGVLADAATEYVLNHLRITRSSVDQNRKKLKIAFDLVSKKFPFNTMPYLLMYITIDGGTFFCLLCMMQIKFSETRNVILGHLFASLHMKKCKEIICRANSTKAHTCQKHLLPSKTENTIDLKHSVQKDENSRSSDHDQNILAENCSLKFTDEVKKEYCKNSNAIDLVTLESDSDSDVEPYDDLIKGKICPACSSEIEIFNEDIKFSMELHMQTHTDVSSVENELESVDELDNVDYICPVCNGTVVIFNNSLNLSVRRHFEEYHKHIKDPSSYNEICKNTRPDLLVNIFDCLPLVFYDHYNFIEVKENQNYCKLCTCLLQLSNDLSVACKSVLLHILETFHQTQYASYLNLKNISLSTDNSATNDIEDKGKISMYKNLMDKIDSLAILTKKHRIVKKNNHYISAVKDYYVCSACNTTVSFAEDEESLLNELWTHFKGKGHGNKILRERPILGNLKKFLKGSSIANKEVIFSLNKYLIEMKNRIFICGVCKEEVTFSEDGRLLKRHIFSTKHDDNLSKLVNHVLSSTNLNLLPCYDNDEVMFQDAFSKLRREFPLNKPSSLIKLVKYDKDSFLCVLCNFKIQSSKTTSDELLAHFCCREHQLKLLLVVPKITSDYLKSSSNEKLLKTNDSSKTTSTSKISFGLLKNMFKCLPDSLQVHQSCISVEVDKVYCKQCDCIVTLTHNLNTAIKNLEDHLVCFHNQQRLEFLTTLSNETGKSLSRTVSESHKSLCFYNSQFLKYSWPTSQVNLKGTCNELEKVQPGIKQKKSDEK